MADFGVVATEVFQVLRSFDYTVRIYDENGMAKTEPAEGRRFMCYPHNLMVSLVDDDDNSRISLNIGKSTNIGDVMGLDQKLRTIATKYNMIFRAQRYGKVIDPKSFSELASITEDIGMHVCEGMYGTSRSSYLRLENARMIVRHKNRIDDSKIGARGRQVESVLVETPAGERHLMPTQSLMAGRAMTQHINQGGGFTDPIGQQITTMATDYQNLATGAQAAISESAVPLREACRSKMGKLRKTFERLYRPNSYAAEAAELAKQEMLTETQFTETRLAEVRQLLQGEHEDAVYECCCKAMDEMAPMAEARRQEPMMSVLGSQVPVSAWQGFWDNNQLALRGEPNLGIPGQAGGMRSALENLAYRLHQISAVATDDGLAMLFDKVADRLPQETDAKRQQIYKAIALRALKAVNKPPGLADQHPAVVEHLRWLNRFDPDRILVERPFNPMHPQFEDPSGMAADSVLAQFSVHDFIDSPEMVDVISGRDPQSDDNHLERDEIIGALKDYLYHQIDLYHPETIEHFDDLTKLAERVYDVAAEGLHDRGFVVDQDAGLAEDTDDLTIEDVLLPKHDQGADLAGEVIPTDVHDPDHPDKHGPADDAYTSRLLTLAGLGPRFESNEPGPPLSMDDMTRP